MRDDRVIEVHANISPAIRRLGKYGPHGSYGDTNHVKTMLDYRPQPRFEPKESRLEKWRWYIGWAPIIFALWAMEGDRPCAQGVPKAKEASE